MIFTSLFRMGLPWLTMGWQTTLGVPVCAVRCLSIKIKKLNRNSIFVTIINMVSAASLCIVAKAVGQGHTTLCVHLLLNNVVIFAPWSLKIKCKKRGSWWFRGVREKSHCGNFWISLGLFFSFSHSLVVCYHDPALLF